MARGMFHEKRVGHAGTLDPMATGVLPVFIGRATRAVEFAAGSDKEYIAGVELFAVYFNGGVHGGKLLNEAGKLGENTYHIFPSGRHGALLQHLPGVDCCFAGLPVLVLKTAGAEKKIRNGAALPVRDVPDGEYRVYGMDKTFLALGRAVGGRLTTVKSFFEV